MWVKSCGEHSHFHTNHCSVHTICHFNCFNHKLVQTISNSHFINQTAPFTHLKPTNSYPKQPIPTQSPFKPKSAFSLIYQQSLIQCHSIPTIILTFNSTQSQINPNLLTIFPISLKFDHIICSDFTLKTTISNIVTLSIYNFIYQFSIIP